MDPILLASASVGVLTFASGLTAMALRRIVPTDEDHIVQTAKKTTPYGKDHAAGNVYYEIPSFIPMFGMIKRRFPTSNFTIKLDGYEAYDVNRVPFVVDVRAFFRIEKTVVAAQRVQNFDALLAQLQAVLQGAVRRVLATNPLETVMQDRSKLGVEFTTEVEAQLTEWGVTNVKNIEFMDIRDSSNSEVIANIMAKDKSRIEKESRVAVADNKRIAQEAEIVAGRIVEVQKQDAIQQVGIRTADQEKTVGIQREKAKQEVAVQAAVTAEKNMAIQQVTDVRAAEIARQVAEVAAAQDRQVTVIAADAAKQSTVISAEAKKAETELVAQGQLAAAKNDAEGLLAIGTSKAEAEKLLLLAPVTAQITLAAEIGSNEGYQDYLVKTETIKANQAVGVKMAEAIGQADLKVIANGGNVAEGVGGLGGLFGPSTGTALSGFLTALGQTPEGQALTSRLTGSVPVAAPTKKKAA